VIVKRLVAIEDLGNVQVLFTDKTGTLTQGQISFTQALDGTGKPDEHVHGLGLSCADKTGNELDRALWAAPQAAHGDTVSAPLDRLPFDHERQLASVLADTHQGRMLISKGAPEAVFARCATVPAQARATLDELFASGTRVVAVASRTLAADHLGKDDERGLSLEGFLCFTDPVKPDVKDSLARLARLGITVKIVTGDNGQVAAHLCREVGVDPGTVVTGQELEQLDDATLVTLLPKTTIFARVTPEQKSRIILAQRSLGSDVAFLGDGVNDAIALHRADVGISVESAADVAKDAAAVVLLDKDLGILADGVVEGRRIFANTIKYVLMGTSSNFGNMFSAAGASLFLNFLPMLPTQILLNNLLYDVSEMTIPTDAVDEELLARPAKWDIRMIRRFMSFFGPISSVYDFLTFGVMLRVFHARPCPVPLRLVRRIPHHADTRHLRDPHPPRPLLQEPPQPPTAHRHPRLRSLRRRPPLYPTARPSVRLQTASAHLPRNSGPDDRHLPRTRPDRRRALLQAPRRPPARPRHQRRRTTHNPQGITLGQLAAPHHTTEAASADR
jgi:Mg2+-importing ATPase